MVINGFVVAHTQLTLCMMVCCASLPQCAQRGSLTHSHSLSLDSGQGGCAAKSEGERELLYTLYIYYLATTVSTLCAAGTKVNARHCCVIPSWAATVWCFCWNARGPARDAFTAVAFYICYSLAERGERERAGHPKIPPPLWLTERLCTRRAWHYTICTASTIFNSLLHAVFFSLFFIMMTPTAVRANQYWRREGFCALVYIKGHDMRNHCAVRGAERERESRCGRNRLCSYIYALYSTR